MRLWRSSQVRDSHALLSSVVSTQQCATASCSATEQQSRPRRRGTKRRSYADYDKVMHEQLEKEQQQTSRSSNVKPLAGVGPSTSGRRVISYTDENRSATAARDRAASSPTPVSSPYTSASRQSEPPLLSRLARGRLLLTLVLFQTRGIAAMMARLADVRAYTAYLHGSVRYVARASCAAEPLDTSAFSAPSSGPASSSSPLSSSEGGETNRGTGGNTSATDTDAPSMKESTPSVEWKKATGKEDKEMRRVAQQLSEGHVAEAALLPTRKRTTTSDARIHMVDSHMTPSVHRNAVCYRGLLQHRVLDCIHVGRSRIHSRGLFTSVSLPKGTRIVAEPQRVYMYAPSFLTLLADTHERLPDTYHYTHPTGSILELVLQPQPHHFFNHSCDANVCCGLSAPFWEAALASGNPRVTERLTQWRNFGDPNSFFATRDVAAGEELTIDYGTRSAAMFAGENGLVGRSLVVCRCGSPRCRHFIYQPPAGVDNILRGKGRGSCGKTSNDESLGDERNTSASPCFCVARDLIGLGFDDETVILSLLPSRRPAVAYLHGDVLQELSVKNAPCTLPCALDSRRAKKKDLLVCCRHVFHLLNETGPAR